MNFDVQVAHSITEIGPDVWDRLGGGQPFTGYHWYRFGERALSADRPLHILLADGGEPVARATFWLRRREPLPISSPVARRAMDAILQRWPLLICQAPLVSATSLVLPPPPRCAAALEALSGVAHDWARRLGASFLLYPYLEPSEVGWSGWPEDLVPVTVPDPGTRLILHWPDFDSYVRQLPKSGRKDYRRHRNRAAAQGIELDRHSRVTDLDEALALIRNVEAHHSSIPNPWARAMLENAHLVAADWLTARIGGRLVGCGLLLGDGDVRFLALLGLDYEVRYVYFQLLYGAIRCAIEGGVGILRGGAGAYDIKRRLGFQLESNNNLVFTGGRAWIRALGRWLVRTEASQPARPARPAATAHSGGR